MPLHLDYPIADLKPAVYNPRKIDEESKQKLQESLRRFGVMKPIIARGNVIVAGHQRTTALKAIGIDRAPVYLLENDAEYYDEIRFNQLHNGTDLDSGVENARVPSGLQPGFSFVKTDLITCDFLTPMAVVRNEICALIVKYGSWGACVCTEAGEIIHAAQYAMACKLLGVDCLVYVLPTADAEDCKAFLGRTYGKFSYDNLEKKTYIQTLAQMFRLRPSTTGRRIKGSMIYIDHVMPWLETDEGKVARILDFGAGQGDYYKFLKRAGYQIFELDFFRRAVNTKTIDVEAVYRQIEIVREEVAANGPFDAVVCDSVLNSVDSPKCHDDVIRAVDALCKRGGHLFFSGRTRESADDRYDAPAAINSRQKRFVEFIDDNGFTSIYREGNWFYQRFHDAAETLTLMDRIGATIVKRKHAGSAWQIHARAGAVFTDPEATKPSVKSEFDLKYNDNDSYSKGSAMLEALKWL